MSEVTIDTLRADVLGLHDKVTTELRGVEAERDGFRSQVTELEAARTAAEAAASAAQARVAQLEADAARVPAGDAGRVAVDTSAMEAGEKIRFGIQQRRAGT